MLRHQQKGIVEKGFFDLNAVRVIRQSKIGIEPAERGDRLIPVVGRDIALRIAFVEAAAHRFPHQTEVMQEIFGELPALRQKIAAVRADDRGSVQHKIFPDAVPADHIGLDAVLARDRKRADMTQLAADLIEPERGIPLAENAERDQHQLLATRDLDMKIAVVIGCADLLESRNDVLQAVLAHLHIADLKLRHLLLRKEPFQYGQLPVLEMPLRKSADIDDAVRMKCQCADDIIDRFLIKKLNDCHNSQSFRLMP